MAGISVRGLLRAQTAIADKPKNVAKTEVLLSVASTAMVNIGTTSSHQGDPKSFLPANDIYDTRPQPSKNPAMFGLAPLPRELNLTDDTTPSP